MSLRLAELEVLAAAESVYNARRAGGGYTLPLSITLQRLDNAVLVYLTALRVGELDSDHNGFDRSGGWSGGHSNEQTTTPDPRSPQAAERRKGCAAADGRKQSDPAKATKAPRHHSSAP